MSDEKRILIPGLIRPSVFEGSLFTYHYPVIVEQRSDMKNVPTRRERLELFPAGVAHCFVNFIAFTDAEGSYKNIPGHSLTITML